MHTKWYLVGIKRKKKKKRKKILCIDIWLRRGGVAGLDRLIWKQFNLANQKGFFIGELVIICAVLKEFWEEFEQSVSIVD